MKKVIPISLLIIGALSIVIVFMINNKTSPESRLKQQFNIDIAGQNYSIVDTKEQWGGNGDGYFYTEITLGRNENIVKDLKANNFNLLPIVEDVPKNPFVNPGDIEKGYYRFGRLDADQRNFKIAVYDSNKNKIFFYYQIN